MEEFNKQPVSFEEDEIDLYEIWLTIKKRKKLILLVTFFITVAAIIISLLLPKVYKTETSLMPLGGEKVSGIASILSSLPISMPTSTSGLTVEAVLKSRTLKERLIKNLNLLPILFEDKWDNRTKTWDVKDKKDIPTVLKGVKALKKLISVSTDKKTGVITLSVQFKKDPLMSYNIAKEALKITREILNEKSFTLAKKYRQYIEKQLKQAKKRIIYMEKIYTDFSEGKIKEIPFITNSKLTDIGSLKGKIITEKEKLKLMNEDSSFSTEDIITQKNKIKNLQKKLKNIGKRLNSDFVSVPKLQFNQIKLQTEIAITEGLYKTLVQEYEMAKATEQKEKIAFQVIDEPYVPEKRFKPKRKLIVIVAFVTGLMLSIFIAFFLEWIEGIKRKESES